MNDEGLTEHKKSLYLLLLLAKISHLASQTKTKSKTNLASKSGHKLPLFGPTQSKGHINKLREP